jgi:hypothetical protein
MGSFKLGNVDRGAMPADKATYLAPYHVTMADDLTKKLQFRDEVSGAWNSFAEAEPVNGVSIRQLQEFLNATGFMPRFSPDGIYGYGTQAAVRLFQEYVRSVEGNPSIPTRAGIGVPDGEAGPTTIDYMKYWQETKAGKPELFVCEWGRASDQSPSAEYLQWIMLLGKAKAHYTAKPDPKLQLIDNYKPADPKITSHDTRKASEWDVRPDTVHLIGIRRNQEVDSTNRGNDDLFILLIRGMVFKFYGSTDPNPEECKDKKGNPTPMPFLIESQHNYQYGWHNRGSEEKTYRALRPAGNGVLVYRAPVGVRIMRDEDVLKGLDPNPNGTINIHWSGMGIGGNWSAGCQVIAGKSYINHKGDLVDCSKFAAGGYKALGSAMTRGAYNVFTDLVLSYSRAGVRNIAYTLGRERTLALSDKEANYVQKEVARLKG